MELAIQANTCAVADPMMSAGSVRAVRKLPAAGRRKWDQAATRRLARLTDGGLHTDKSQSAAYGNVRSRHLGNVLGSTAVLPRRRGSGRDEEGSLFKIATIAGWGHDGANDSSRCGRMECVAAGTIDAVPTGTAARRAFEQTPKPNLTGTRSL